MLVLDGLIVLHGVAQDRKGLLSLLPKRIIEFKSILMMFLCVPNHCLFLAACLQFPEF